MAWEQLSPTAYAGKITAKRPIKISASLGVRRLSPRLMLMFRPLEIDPRLGWLCVGSNISVLLGTGEDAGRMRIKPDGPLVLQNIAKRAGASVIATMSMPPVFAPLAHKPTEVNFQVSDGAITVTLPGWLMAAYGKAAYSKHTPASASEPRAGHYQRPPQPAEATKQKFSMVGGDVYHPTVKPGARL